MPGVRFDRFLASTAIILLASGVAGSSLAEPKSGSNNSPAATEAAVSAPAATSAPTPEADQPSTKPAGNPGEQIAPATKPEASTERPAAATAKIDEPSNPPMPMSAAPATTEKPDGSSDKAAAPSPKPIEATAEPAAAAVARTSDQRIEEPVAPAAAAPAATPEPAAAAAPAATPEPAAAAAPAATPEPATAAAPAATPEPAAAAGGGDEVPTVATVPPAAPSGEAATAPAPVAADAYNPVADQLRELANGKFDRLLGGKKERAAIDAFYSARNYAPLWSTDGKVNERAQAAIAYLGHVDADGLEPAEYPVPSFASLADPLALAEADLRLTLSVISYAHHAAIGRVHWSRVSGDILYELKAPAPAEVLAEMANAKDVGGALGAYEPHAPGYLALKAKLAELRAGKETGKASIPSGQALKVGMQDDRVPLLRERLAVTGEGTTYDKPLADAVKKFQQAHELKASGLLTSQTVEALNGRQPDRPIDTIIANMERWRWMPHELGKNYVIVNLPDFTLRVMQNGHQVWTTKIVDGKPEMPTPIMSAEMKFITINPTWNVPPSIVAKEYMPALQQDPTVLARMGLKVSTNPDGTVHISQPPGDANALGRVRFNFPNKFLVYQHDTPNKNLFALSKRAFSHGCMRVEDPVKYAEVLLSIVRPGDGYTQERIRRMFGESEQDIQFPKFLPVHLTYQTAFVDEDGKLEFRDDVYGRDKALLAILKGDERKVADIAVERRENSVRREALAMPDQPSFFGGRSYYPGGGNFFTRLFGAPEPPPAPPPRNRAAQSRQEIH
jgi:murein L,D-transpeptidase YcbB/YkuD